MPIRIEKTEGGKFAVRSKHTGETMSTHATSEQANDAVHAQHMKRMETRTSSDFTHSAHHVEPMAFKDKPQMSDAKEQKHDSAV